VRQDDVLAPDVQSTAGPQNKTRPTPVGAQNTTRPALVGAPEREIVVSSILYSPNRQLALIDGRIARAGDRIGSSRIVDIGPHAIVVESADGKRRTVELHVVTSARGRR
jgi:hypothetical protein